MAKGGSRYGAGRPGYKVTAESLHRVDVRLWVRKRYICQDAERRFSWSWTSNGEPGGSINVAASTRETVLNYRLRASTGDDWQAKRDCVTMSQTPCRYGGVRHWFHCPTCQRRCEVLYLRFGRFACRQCNRVAYTSQRGGPLDRLQHKLTKLQNTKGEHRPRGMHHKTWERLQNDSFELELQLDDLFASRAIALFGAAALL